MDGNAMPMTYKGNNHIMVLIDAATKYVMLKPTRGESAKAAAKLLRSFTYRICKPKKVTTDQGSCFTSKEFKEACVEIGAKLAPVMARQPQANGQVERINKDINDMVAKVCARNPKDWEDKLLQIEYAINTTKSKVTGYSPYEAVFGREPNEPGVITAQDIIEDTSAPTKEVEIEHIEADIQDKQAEAAKMQKNYHDKKVKPRHFTIGDKVRLFSSKNEQGVPPKLTLRWKGPFKVIRKIGPVTYEVEDLQTKLVSKAHARDLMKVTEERDWEDTTKRTRG